MKFKNNSQRKAVFAKIKRQSGFSGKPQVYYRNLDPQTFKEGQRLAKQKGSGFISVTKAKESEKKKGIKGFFQRTF